MARNRKKQEQDGEDESGELCIRSPSTMLGYYQDEEATRRVMRDGWLLSGDEGFWRMYRGQPVFYVTGRLKEIIIRDAEKASLHHTRRPAPASFELRLHRRLERLDQ